jgi:hypothetical protein
VELIGLELWLDGEHLGVADLDAAGVAVVVGIGVDGQPGPGGGRCDEFDDDLVAGPWSPSPVAGDSREQPMFNLG